MVWALLIVAGLLLLWLVLRLERKHRYQRKWQRYARQNGMQYYPKAPAALIRALGRFNLLRHAKPEHLTHLLSLDQYPYRVTVMQHKQLLRLGTTRTPHAQTIFYFDTGRALLPDFELRPEYAITRPGKPLKAYDMPLADASAFSRLFRLMSRSPKAVQPLFSDELKQFFQNHRTYCIAVEGSKVIIYEPGIEISDKALPNKLRKAENILTTMTSAALRQSYARRQQKRAS
ncbi:hypothetical protein [Salinibius halmophilus]|uniref:hypothetical protein n=1 Tax=Salinibius halmophilus TaxID=1853216 RepID=UPI000E670765|nr:hypothetical protein [Salinibius halmophilus]